MTPTPHTSQAIAEQMREKRLALRQQLQRIAHTMLDKMEIILDQVGKPELPERSVTVERRQVANCLGMYQFCPHARCRRRRCCLGEPVDCLRTGLCFVPIPQLERLLKSRARPRRRRA